MEQIRFEPLITAGRSAEHRRGQSGQNPSQDMFADMLGDQLKKRSEVERADLPVRRRMSEQRSNAGEHLTGRAKKPLILTHPKTLRGTAEEVEQPAETHRSHASDRAQEVVAENPASDRAKLVVAGITGESTDTPAEPAPDDKEQDTNATAQVPSTIQVAEEAPAAPIEGDELTVPEVLVPAEGDAAADTADMPSDDETTTESQAAPSEAAPSEEAPVAEIAQAAADADLAATLVSLETGTAATTNATTLAQSTGEAPPTAPATAPATARATAPAETPLATTTAAEIEATIVQPAQANEPKPAKASLEAKPRATPATHTAPEAAKPGAQPATPATPAQPHLVAGTQGNTPAEFADGAGDQALGEGNGFGQGWALHLAQGAAAKRPDFVAQLKQHLQNLPAHEQVAIHVQRALREGTNRFSIQLSPQELGRIQVKLEIDEEKRVTAAISVERPSTLELLQRDARGLERALQDAGLKLDGGNLSFSLSQSGDQEWAQELERQGLGGSGAESTETKPVGEDIAAQAPSVLDTAAGVADLQV